MRSTYERVVTIISTILEIDKTEINETTNLFDELDIDSLTILEIVNEIETEWKIKLTEHPELLDEMQRIETLVVYLDNQIGRGE